MSSETIINYSIFGLLALVTLGGALKVATTRSIIHAAFWLFPVFAGIAGFYLYLGTQFLAAIQVLIYIGAILVLIVFAVTLTRNAADTDEAQSNRFSIPVALSALVLLVALGGSAWVSRFREIPDLEKLGMLPGSNVPVTDVQAIGLTLLQQYLLPFEIASVLLLAAMVGAIVMARKERENPVQGVETESCTPVAKEIREPVEV